MSDRPDGTALAGHPAMGDPLQALLAASADDAVYPANSRYHGVERAVREDERGKPIVYLRRRFPPRPERLGTLGIHEVVDGNRLDNVAAERLGDPELFWQVCDANRAMRPWRLTERPGRPLRIPLPLGVPGGQRLGG